MRQPPRNDVYNHLLFRDVHTIIDIERNEATLASPRYGYTVSIIEHILFYFPSPNRDFRRV